MLRSRQSRTVAAILVLLLLGLLLVPAVTPVRLGAVSTSHMEPTLSPGDGYVAVPAGDVSVGDVVVYWNASGGSFEVSRVTSETATVFRVLGDAENTSTIAEQPIVPRSAVVATIPRIAGIRLVFPGMGGVTTILQSAQLLALFGALVLLAGLLIRRRRGRRVTQDSERAVLRVRDVTTPILAVVLVALVAVPPFGASTYQLTYVAGDGGSSTQQVPVDEPVTRNVTIEATHLPFTHTVVRGTGVDVTTAARNGSTLDLHVRLPPPGSPGPVRYEVAVVPYPASLPGGVVERLHDVSPLVSALATALAVFLPLYLLVLVLFDPDRPISTGRSTVVDGLRRG